MIAQIIPGLLRKRFENTASTILNIIQSFSQLNHTSFTSTTAKAFLCAHSCKLFNNEILRPHIEALVDESNIPICHDATLLCQYAHWALPRYEQYFADVTTSAKAFIELGLEQHRSVCINILDMINMNGWILDAGWRRVGLKVHFPCINPVFGC